MEKHVDQKRSDVSNFGTILLTKSGWSHFVEMDFERPTAEPIGYTIPDDPELEIVCKIYHNRYEYWAADDDHAPHFSTDIALDVDTVWGIFYLIENGHNV